METKDEAVVILAAGDYPTRAELQQLLHQSQRVICCDSAAEEFMRRVGHKPWRIVGDLDSLPREMQDALADIIVHEKEQETNDLSKAVRYALSLGVSKAKILGATGRREDHTLGNISLLIDFMHQGLKVRMLTDHGYFVPCCNHYASVLPLGTQLSIFSFGATGFKAEGLRYPLYDFTNWWQGTLNETVIPAILVEATGDFLVYVNLS